MAARVGADAGTGDHSCQSNPATEPEAHGDDLDARNHVFMRDARLPQRREAQVRDCDDGCPATIEEHEVDRVGEGPGVIESAND